MKILNKDSEVVVKLANGMSLRSGVYNPKPGSLLSGEYVRLCDKKGRELVYWDNLEWQEDPVLVMGAILNAAAGYNIPIKKKKN